MAAPKTVKEVPVQKGTRGQEKRAKKPIVVAEIKNQEECCEPGCGPDTCRSS